LSNPFDDNISNFHWSSQLQPAAGAEAPLTPLDNCLAELRVLEFELITSADVANRQIRITAVSPTQEITIGAAGTILPASQDLWFVFGVGLQHQTVTLGDRILSPLVPLVKILYPWQWYIRVDGIQAADQIRAISTYFRFWPDTSQ